MTGFEYIPNPYFKEAKLRCQHTGIYHFDEIFLKHLIEIREWVNFGMVISSAYRHESHPIESAKILQGKKPGSHSLGRAVDIKIRGNKCYSLIEQCVRKGFRIGVSQSGKRDFCTSMTFPLGKAILNDLFKKCGVIKLNYYLITMKTSPLEDRFEKLLKKHKIKYKKEVPVIKGRKFRWDFLVTIRKKGTPLRKIGVEVQGGAWLGRRGGHSGGKGIERDCYKALLAHQTGVELLYATAKGEASLEVVADYIAGLKK